MGMRESVSQSDPLPMKRMPRRVRSDGTSSCMRGKDTTIVTGVRIGDVADGK
jgi:hypothetical protein